MANTNAAGKKLAKIEEEKDSHITPYMLRQVESLIRFDTVTLYMDNTSRGNLSQLIQLKSGVCHEAGCSKDVIKTRCKLCKCGYCSAECQRKNWEYHKTHCVCLW